MEGQGQGQGQGQGPPKLVRQKPMNCSYVSVMYDNRDPDPIHHLRLDFGTKSISPIKKRSKSPIRRTKNQSENLSL